MRNNITNETMESIVENLWYLSKILTEEEFMDEAAKFLVDEGIVEINEE